MVGFRLPCPKYKKLLTKVSDRPVYYTLLARTTHFLCLGVRGCWDFGLGFAGSSVSSVYARLRNLDWNRSI